MSETSANAGPLHAFLSGRGGDGWGRGLAEVLAWPDVQLEHVHDYIQWLFPLPVRSAAQPGAPVLTPAEIGAIRADADALANLDRAQQRMLQFYGATDHWLTAYDHNHLRITRIITSLRLLVGDEAARRFHAAIMARHAAAGAPVNRQSLHYWARAVAGED